MTDKAAKPQKHYLTGLFFHILENREIQRQGRVEKVIDGKVFARCFSFFDGCPSYSIEIYDIEDTKEWLWYLTDKDMRMNAYHREGKSPHDIESEERMIERLK